MPGFPKLQVPAIRQLPPVNAKPAPTPTSTGEALTIDALMARQKDAAQRQGGNMQQQVTNIPQGLSQMAWTLVNALQQRKAEKEEGVANQEISGAFSQMDPTTGELPPEALQALMRRDPGTGMEMYKTAMLLRAQKQKAEADAAATGAWKPSDIAARADDYTKAAATYDSAAPSWQSMQESWNRVKDLKTGDTSPGAGTADYNLVIGLAKLLDPNSVVREGEVDSVRRTGGQTDYLISYINTLTGGGSLSPEVRRGLMTEANGRMKAYYDQAAGKRQWIGEVATRHGVNPDDVVPPLAPFTPWTPGEDPNKPDEPALDELPPDPNTPLPARPNWYNPEAWPTPEEWAVMKPEDKAAIIAVSKRATPPGQGG